jgi:hypothetical protein
MNQLLQQAQGMIGQQPQSFEPIAQAATKRFQTESIPALAERLGELGGQSKYSSGFTGGLLGAEAGLQENLAGMEQQFGQQQFQNAMQLLQAGLQPQFDTGIRPAQSGLLQPLAGSVGQAAGQAGTMALLLKLLPLLGGIGGGVAEGPAGAAVGSGLGSVLGGL